jgi:hypothetical protein
MQCLKFSYVLPEQILYAGWPAFEHDLLCIKEAGYDAVELQVADPVQFDAKRVATSLRLA